VSLDTILHSGLTRQHEKHSHANALVLMGGGARTAYQVGVLRAMAAMLNLQPSHEDGAFPFQVLVGTSAGALNSTFLAGTATEGLKAFEDLAKFWSSLRSSAVYELRISTWLRASRMLTALSLARMARERGGILDTMPLVDTLHRAISLPGIEYALQTRAIDALAISASSYTSGVHWTFCHTARPSSFQSWTRPGRRAEYQPVNIEHLMASSAIPFIFPATKLWVDGRAEFFGDGSMRQISPLSPAMHLGADRVFVIGAGQPQRSGLVGGAADDGALQLPTLGSIAGYAMASVFHDTVQADVEQTQRVTRTLRDMPRELAAAMPYRPVEVLAIMPTQSLDALAQLHAHELPGATRNVLEGLGALKGGGAALASYLLFEPGFIKALMQLGERDAYARKAEILAFFADPA
jgi:NTE family protein